MEGIFVVVDSEASAKYKQRLDNIVKTHLTNCS